MAASLHPSRCRAPLLWLFSNLLNSHFGSCLKFYGEILEWKDFFVEKEPPVAAAVFYRTVVSRPAQGMGAIQEPGQLSVGCWCAVPRRCCVWCCAMRDAGCMCCAVQHGLLVCLAVLDAGAICWHLPPHTLTFATKAGTSCCCSWVQELGSFSPETLQKAVMADVHRKVADEMVTL